MLSSPFSRGAGLVTPACLSFLSAIMRHKDLMGAASCGCFGSVPVDPWLTLLAIDLPSVVALGLFRPPSAFAPLLSFLRSLPSVVIGGREPKRMWRRNVNSFVFLAGVLGRCLQGANGKRLLELA